MSAPVEFRTSPLGEFTDGPNSPMVWTWESTVAIDLRWVASAQPTFSSLNATQICMAGNGNWLTIDIPYSDFMRMWTDAMEKRA